MDVYGYRGQQYNQSDGLSNQLFDEHSSSMPFQNRSVSEPHIMPAPSGSPWNVQGLTWSMPSPPQLVQFNALNQHPLNNTLHCKRKSFDTEPLIPTKQFITEERMAAHMNGLHISSDYTSHSQSEYKSMDYGQMDTSRIPSVSSAEQANERLKGHRLVLSDELKRLTDEPILPVSLIERLEKPCLSLMVWKPKDNIIETKLKKIVEEDKESDAEDSKKRNGLLVAESVGCMDVEM